MSIYATKWAYAQPVKPAGRKFVLVAIADFADSEGRAFPGVETIATMTGQDERSVRRHIDGLEKSGYIKCEERRRKDGSRTTDEIWLQAPESALKPQSVTTGQNVRLQEPTGQFDQTNRTICHPSPDNLSGRTEPSVNHHLEPSLKKENPVTAGAVALSPEMDELQNQNHTGQGMPVHSQVDQSPGGNVENPGHQRENVPGGAAGAVENPVDNRKNARPSDFKRIISAWNANRGSLPEVQTATEGRRKAVKKLLRDCEGDVDRAVQVVIEATREVAQDEFWQGHRYGFDNLVPGKVFGRAEAWRARQGQPSPAAGQAQPAKSTRVFVEGQRVLYKQLAYTVERVHDTSIDLYDEENGSSTVFLNSNDWNAIKPAGGQL